VQVDSIGNDRARMGKAIGRAMSLLAAVALAAGLVTVDVPEADLTPHVLGTGANAHRIRAASPAEPAVARPSEELDPAVPRSDQGADVRS
jgi:hypothetical protein